MEGEVASLQLFRENEYCINLWRSTYKAIIDPAELYGLIVTFLYIRGRHGCPDCQFSIFREATESRPPGWRLCQLGVIPPNR